MEPEVSSWGWCYGLLVWPTGVLPLGTITFHLPSRHGCGVLHPSASLLLHSYGCKVAASDRGRTYLRVRGGKPLTEYKPLYHLLRNPHFSMADDESASPPVQIFRCLLLGSSFGASRKSDELSYPGIALLRMWSCLCICPNIPSC